MYAYGWTTYDNRKCGNIPDMLLARKFAFPCQNLGSSLAQQRRNGHLNNIHGVYGDGARSGIAVHHCGPGGDHGFKQPDTSKLLEMHQRTRYELELTQKPYLVKLN